MEVIRKDIKNLHVGVYPPSGRVRVAAPLRLDDDAEHAELDGALLVERFGLKPLPM